MFEWIRRLLKRVEIPDSQVREYTAECPHVDTAILIRDKKLKMICIKCHEVMGYNRDGIELSKESSHENQT